MRLLQLIDLYSRICEKYDTCLIGHYFRHTKNSKEPDFTDQELLTCYFWCVGWEGVVKINRIHALIKNHLLDGVVA